MTIQVTVQNEDLKILRKLREYYKEIQDREFEGKAWLVDRSRYRKGKRIRRTRITNSYVIRLAILSFWDKIKEDLEKREREAKHIIYEPEKRKRWTRPAE